MGFLDRIFTLADYTQDDIKKMWELKDVSSLVKVYSQSKDHLIKSTILEYLKNTWQIEDVSSLVKVYSQSKDHLIKSTILDSFIRQATIEKSIDLIDAYLPLKKVYQKCQDHSEKKYLEKVLIAVEKNIFESLKGRPQLTVTLKIGNGLIFTGKHGLVYYEYPSMYHGCYYKVVFDKDYKVGSVDLECREVFRYESQILNCGDPIIVKYFIDLKVISTPIEIFENEQSMCKYIGKLGGDRAHYFLNFFVRDHYKYFGLPLAAIYTLIELGDARDIPLFIELKKYPRGSIDIDEIERLLRKLGVTDIPATDEKYCVENNLWDTCVKIGSRSIGPLISALSENQCGDHRGNAANTLHNHRKGAAETLIQIYKTSILSDEDKKNILAIASLLKQPHQTSHEDYQRSWYTGTHNDYFSCHHDGTPRTTHIDKHTDLGIGLTDDKIKFLEAELFGK